MTRNQLHYQGKLAQYQQEGESFKGKKYQKILYTERQDYLYNRLIYGLAAFPEEELMVMQDAKKSRIDFFHRKAQRLINRAKQERIKILSNHVFKTFFPKSPLAKSFIYDKKDDSKILNKMELSNLKITKEDLIDLFIKEKLLPKNFYNKQNLIACK